MVKKNVNLIVGYGGNGHTYLMRFLLEKITMNNKNNNDGLKHMAYPNYDNKLLKRIRKCIFLYNDPFKSIKSHMRRNYIYQHVMHMNNPFNIDLSLLNMKDLNNKNKLINLTVKHGEDIFGIKQQFDNWINSNCDFPILFLDFNDILKEKNKINKFLNIDIDWSGFEIKKKRTYFKFTNNKEFKKIYEDLYEYIKNKSNEYNKKYNDL